jgi:hypothetical protein
VLAIGTLFATPGGHQALDAFTAAAVACHYRAMAEPERRRWKRRVGVFRFEPRSVWVGGERVLDGGRDAPLPPRRHRLWLAYLVTLTILGVVLILLSR